MPCSFVLLLPDRRVLLRPLHVVFLRELAHASSKKNYGYVFNDKHWKLMKAVVYCLGTFYSNLYLHFYVVFTY
ncbi:hypothetical protein OIU78_029378 [Salix suchowensis]|uniref:Uncharacterized protein n=1 Tax=Salix purpurea TaxID=77065 RepID=A0A9Q0W466_SALPP|nr:hypothetical protein OIU78_029378 [Salix suchowensis]KAJ6760202.1 hypothetical protein OIU79_025134 [Salix purpurea]